MSGIDFDAFDNGTKNLKKQEDVVDSLILEDDEDDELLSEPPKKMKDDISESKPKVHNDKAEVTKTTSANNHDDSEKEIVKEPKENSTDDDSNHDEPKEESQPKVNKSAGKDHIIGYIVIGCILVLFCLVLLPKYLSDNTVTVEGIQVTTSKYDLKGNTLEDYFDKRVRDLQDHCISYSDGTYYTLYYTNAKDYTKLDVEVFSRSFSIYSVKKFTINNSGEDKTNRELIYKIVKESGEDEMKDLVLPSSK